MVSEVDLKREARLIALERLACHTYNLVLQALDASEDQINAAETQALEKLRMVPVEGKSPEISDVLSDETVLDLARLLSQSRDWREMARD